MINVKICNIIRVVVLLLDTVTVREFLGPEGMAIGTNGGSSQRKHALTEGEALP